MKDYYYILGIESEASDNEIKKAYRKLSIKFHPDKNNGDKFFENRFKEIQEAYETLSNKNKRVTYDSKFKNRNHFDSHNRKSRAGEKGEIISFDVSKKNVSNNEEVTFFWATKNISKVKLSCFKEYLPATGKKTLKIKSERSKVLTVTLEAYEINNNIFSQSEKVYLKITPIQSQKENNKENEKNSKPNRRKIQPSKNSNLKPLLLVFIPFLILAIIFINSSKSNKRQISQRMESQQFSNMSECSFSKENLNFKVANTNLLNDVSTVLYYKRNNESEYHQIPDIPIEINCENISYLLKFHDFNFDDRIDFAIPIYTPGAGSSWYITFHDFYVQNIDGTFSKNEYLTETIHDIPKIDKSSNYLITSRMKDYGSTHYNEYYKFNQKKNTWEHIKDVCTNCESELTKTTQNTMTKIFKIKEWTSDTSAICLVNNSEFEDSYGNSSSGSVETYSISYLNHKDIKFNSQEYRFMYFHTLPVRRENQNWIASDCRWCDGHLTVARFIKHNSELELSELLYDCACGKSSTWGSVEIPRISSIEGKHLILDASDYYFNNPVSLTTANLCNALNLYRHLSFSQGGNSEDGKKLPDFKLENISYEIRKGSPVVKTNGGIRPYFDIGSLFDLKNEIIEDLKYDNSSKWYEDDPAFKSKTNTLIRAVNKPYDLLQDYYDNFSKKETTIKNYDVYSDTLVIHHNKQLITKDDALNRDYRDFEINNIQSYQILVQAASMVTYKFGNFDIVNVPVMYYVTKSDGGRSKFKINISAVLNESNTKIYAIGKNITLDKLNTIVAKTDNKSIASKPKNNIYKLTHGSSPYSYCFGDNNDCNISCSQISVKASTDSDVIVLIRNNGTVYRNAFISRGMSYTFNLPNGTYQPFFYYGQYWDNEKYMKETTCGALYGGFKENEHFGKDSPQYLENKILSYELILQRNGNFSTKSSSLNEAF